MGLFDNLKDQALKGMNGLASNLKEQLNEYQNPQTNQEVPPPAPSQTPPEPTSKQLYNQHLENLIEMALADGELTEKEKQVLFKKAEAQGIDLDEFEMVLDAKLYEKQKSMMSEKPSSHLSAPKSDKYGDVRKCPGCGAIVESFTTRCPDCGFEFSNVTASTSITTLFKKIQEIEASRTGSVFSGIAEMYGMDRITRQKQALIRNFPIPTTKGDILEFLVMGVPLAKEKGNFLTKNSDENRPHNSFVPVWKAKIEQVIMKARFSMKDDKQTLAEIERYAQELKIK